MISDTNYKKLAKDFLELDITKLSGDRLIQLVTDCERQLKEDQIVRDRILREHETRSYMPQWDIVRLGVMELSGSIPDQYFHNAVKEVINKCYIEIEKRHL